MSYCSIELLLKQSKLPRLSLTTTCQLDFYQFPDQYRAFEENALQEKGSGYVISEHGRVNLLIFSLKPNLVAYPSIFASGFVVITLYLNQTLGNVNL
jgi:hypothetical protein